MGQGFPHQLPVLEYKYLSCVSGVDGKILVTAYAALRPRDGFSHPHQKHMLDTFSCIFYYLKSDDFYFSKHNGP